MLIEKMRPVEAGIVAEYSPRPAPRMAEPCNMSKDTIESLAESAAEVWKYNSKLSLEDMVTRFGGVLRVTDDFKNLTRGSITVFDEQDFVINIPTFVYASRDRFTIAHELGHFVLHYLWPKFENPDFGPIYASRYGSDDNEDDLAETEANWFASAFLMPAKATKDAWKKLKSVAGVAAEFNVLQETARLRLKSLGVATV